MTLSLFRIKFVLKNLAFSLSFLEGLLVLLKIISILLITKVSMKMKILC